MGFLLSSLLGSLIIPSIWKRAVRLTKKRYEETHPVRLSEFLAEKDQLRAQFALSTRKLERKIEKLRQQLSERLAELNEIKSELALKQIENDKFSIIANEVEARNKKLNKHILQLEKKNADISQKLRMREREFDSKKRELQQRILELEKQIVSLSQKLQKQEKQLEESNISPQRAEQQIAKANNMLDRLASETKKEIGSSKGGKRQLAQDLAYEENLEKLHDKISQIRTKIHAKWQNNKNDVSKKKSFVKKADLENIRNDLEKIASIVFSLDNLENDKAKEKQKKEQSLLERVQKFVNDESNIVKQRVKSNQEQSNNNYPIMGEQRPAKNKDKKATTTISPKLLSKRLKAMRNHK